MSKRHKKENVFKFKNFSDRIAEVDLRSAALYKIEHVNEIPDENRSYFYQIFEKWSTLNLSQEFVDFSKLITKVNTTTLPQIVHHKDKVIEIMITHFEHATTLSLQPLLELTVALARDLRGDFYEHFQKFFDILIKLLETQDADQTEWTLVCLAHLFKILKPFLCKEIAIVINRVIPLMSDTKQPEYVINFAVESFAFIVRNLKDKEGVFLKTILRKAKKDDSCVMGCGKLFYEMIRGLNGQFHSKGGEFLARLFDAFRRSEYEEYWDTLKEILVQTIDDLLNYIENKFISTYWDVLHEAFENVLKDKSLSVDKKSSVLHYLLHFLGQSIECYSGQKIIDVQRIINLVIQVLDQDFALSEEKKHVEVVITVSQIGAVLLLSKNFMIGQLEASRLKTKILSTPHREVFESFVVNSISCAQFDILIMPDFIKYFERNFSKSSIEIMAKIIEMRKSSELLDDSEFDGYNIHFKNQKTVHAITNFITKYSDIDDDCEDFLLAVQILPHMVTYEKDKIEMHLKKLCRSVLKHVNDDIKHVYLLAVIVTTIHNISAAFEESEILDIIISALGINHTLTKLKIIKYFVYTLKQQNQSKLTADLFDKIRESLSGNLISRYQQIRLLTAQILASFDHLKQEKGGKGSIYTTFKQIEEITPTIQTYRDQVLLLQRLDYDSRFFQELRDSRCTEDALKFIIGFYHVNFQPLWDSTRGILESYAVNIETSSFWEIFHSQLKKVRSESESTEASLESFTENEFIQEKFKEFTTVTDRYDAISYRVKLLQVLHDTKSNVCDIKQKDVVELFFDFLQNEYNSPDDDVEGEGPPKGRQKLLINHLQVLTKFSNPKCVTKTEELYKLYIELLSHRNFQVQKLALDCIMHYKEPALVNYKEVLYNCVNEKTTRNEIMALNLDEKIQNEYREGFIKIFLPILYSKLTIKAGKKDQEGFKTKKEIIVRFMNHLKEHELEKLTDIAIGKVNEVPWSSNTTDFIQSVEDANFKVNELQSKLQFLDLLRKNVAGSFSENYQRKILRATLAISSSTYNPPTKQKTVSNGLEESAPAEKDRSPPRKAARKFSKVRTKSHDTSLTELQSVDAPDARKEKKMQETAIYKNLNQSCQHSIVEFFEQYDSFTWNEDEIELVFEIFIWQYLEIENRVFSRDASQNITGLMRLFVEWSKNPKYFVFLERKNSAGHYPIKSILELLTNKSTSSEVTDCVMEILERLLTLIAEEEEVITFNYGTRLIEPFIKEILMKLKDKMCGQKTKTFGPRNLLILSRVTELVKDQDDSKLLLDILFPLTLKKIAEDNHDSDGIMKLLTTISNLLKVVDQPESYLRSYAPLFEHIVEVNQRKLLVKTFNLLCRDDEFLSAIVNDINAYDKRWIEQPDFEKRLSAFHRLEKSDVSIELAVIVIYHCFHFLKYEKDLAMRDNSSHYLKVICSKIIAKYGDDRVQLSYFMDKIILNLLSKKIRVKTEMRTEAINLLGELARTHPQVHPILNDLHSLTDANNRELDFFDNITHLQKFRHMKALRRFVDTAKTYKQMPNLRTLNDFLLPISKIFLCTDEYQRKSKVIEAAIDYVACICKFLPWNQYEMVLKFYINKMKNDSKAYQRQLVKLIPAILDSFHYTLSTGEQTTKVVEISVQEEKVEEAELDDGNDENENESDNEEELIEDEEEEESSKAIEEITILRPNVSQRVVRSLTQRLIPSLFKIISELSNTTAHKLNKEERRLKEKEDMIKIPIALPLIKLLQKLPQKFLKQYLSQVVLKVSTFLKSTLKQVRATARHTLREMLVALGVEHLEVVIENLSVILAKGFQVHVLSVTVHTLIEALKSQLVSSNVTDKILRKVLDICFNDIFGKNNEEYEVGKIGNRTPEAKASRKSFLTLNILASTLGEKCILDLIVPFKNLLLETQSKKTVMKIQECLVQIASGLTVNTKIPIDALMILIHGTISESIPNLLPEKRKQPSKEIRKTDCFIIQEEPKRRGATAMNKTVKASKQTNTYVLVEFGLEMLHILMKKKKLEGAEGFLDPLISLLVDAMKGNFLRVNMLAIRCFTIMWHQKMVIDNLKTHTNEVATETFAILHKYATTEISRRDNHYLLVKSAFKSVVVLIRHVDYYTVNENQLKALLLYIEQDIAYGNDKDTISFVLLKAILDKKLIVPEIHEVMTKIAEMSITSDIVERRTVMRPIILTYLMEYPLGKKIDQLLKFFIAQLNYDDISGRDSTIEMMRLIFRHFPQPQLSKLSGLFFLSLGTRLVNDDSPTCREKIASALELLINQVSKESQIELYEIVIMLLKDNKLVHREMAAQLIIRFINAASSDFIAPKMSNLLSSLSKSISNSLNGDDEPGKFVRVKRQKLDDDDDDVNMSDERDQQTIEDHHLIQTLNAMIKLLEYNDGAIMKDVDSEAVIDEIGFKVHELLSHDHTWVRLRALKIINIFVKHLDLSQIHEILKSDEKVEDNVKFLYSKAQLQSVAFDMVVQIKPDVEQELLEALFESLLEIAKVLKDLPFSGMVNDKKDFNLMWLIRRLRYAIHNEIAAASNSCVLRKSIFNFFNDLVGIMKRETIMKLASSMLTPMLREMVEGEHVIEELKQVAMQVGNRIKTLIGLQEYDNVRLDLQKKMLRKRVDRRKAQAQEKINNPAKAATRTIMKQLKKQDTKKRKRQDIQEGIVLPKKKRRVFGNAMTDTYE